MAVEKINAILDAFDKMGDIPENTDLNTFTVAGMYGCRNSATARTLVNSPTTESFAMFVLSSADDNIKASIQTGKRQLLIANTNMYFRGATSTSWSAWKKVEYTTVS